MPKHAFHKPVSRGLTLVELAIGIAILGTMVLVVAGLFKAGIVTYNYSMHQLLDLTHTRKALTGEGESRGLISSVQDALSVVNLSSSTLTIKPSEGAPIRYYVSEGTLYQSQWDVPTKQSDGLQDLQLRYYSLNERGRLIESISPDAAAFVAAYIKTPTCQERDCVYFSGAALRNR